uniref:Uncharacterized protein n=1 Tax=Arion vulgaris TaxID=1028688 RepID=A0A0B7BD45_9EUPU
MYSFIGRSLKTNTFITDITQLLLACKNGKLQKEISYIQQEATLVQPNPQMPSSYVVNGLVKPPLEAPRESLLPPLVIPPPRIPPRLVFPTVPPLGSTPLSGPPTLFIPPLF